MELGDKKLGVVSVFVFIKDVKLKFLLDIGASHNFLSLHNAKSLGLPVYLVLHILKLELFKISKLRNFL